MLAADPPSEFSAFHKNLRPLVITAVGHIVDELSEGFLGEQKDFFEWYKANILNYYKPQYAEKD